MMMTDAASLPWWLRCRVHFFCPQTQYRRQTQTRHLPSNPARCRTCTQHLRPKGATVPCHMPSAKPLLAARLTEAFHRTAGNTSASLPQGGTAHKLVRALLLRNLPRFELTEGETVLLRLHREISKLGI